MPLRLPVMLPPNVSEKSVGTSAWSRDCAVIQQNPDKPALQVTLPPSWQKLATKQNVEIEMWAPQLVFGYRPAEANPRNGHTGSISAQVSRSNFVFVQPSSEFMALPLDFLQRVRRACRQAAACLNFGTCCIF